MAKINSKDVNLYVNQGDETTPDWVKIACSTSDGFSGTTDNVEIATKCNDGFKENLPSSKSWEFTNSGYAETVNEAGQESYVTAEELWRSGDVKQFKIASTTEGDYYRMGSGYISAYSETAAEGDYLQFELTVMGTGTYTVTPPAAV